MLNASQVSKMLCPRPGRGRLVLVRPFWKSLLTLLPVGALAAALGACAQGSNYNFTEQVNAPYEPFSRCVLRTLQTARYAPITTGSIAYEASENAMLIWQHDFHIEYFHVGLARVPDGTAVKVEMWPLYSSIAARRVNGVIRDALRTCATASA